MKSHRHQQSTWRHFPPPLLMALVLPASPSAQVPTPIEAREDGVTWQRKHFCTCEIIFVILYIYLHLKQLATNLWLQCPKDSFQNLKIIILYIHVLITSTRSQCCYIRMANHHCSQWVHSYPWAELHQNCWLGWFSVIKESKLIVYSSVESTPFFFFFCFVLPLLPRIVDWIAGRFWQFGFLWISGVYGEKKTLL